MQRCCARVRAIAREALPQIGQPHIGAVLLDQALKADPTAALAAMAGDIEHGQLALQLAIDPRLLIAVSPANTNRAGTPG